MKTEIAVAGFGGQGIVFAGVVLAGAALQENLNVSWLPSYGPEMRGGRAYCTVIVSDEEIDSPLLDRPDLAVIMSSPALTRFSSLVNTGGFFLLNSSIVTEPVSRPDVSVLPVPAGHLATQIGLDKAANMVLAGAMLSFTNPFSALVTPQSVLASIRSLIGPKDSSLADLNCRAFTAGYDFGRRHLPASCC